MASTAGSTLNDSVSIDSMTIMAGNAGPATPPRNISSNSGNAIVNSNDQPSRRCSFVSTSRILLT